MSAAETGLGRCGEAVWVGVLTCVFSVPLVTALAAHAAALDALDPARAGSPDLTVRYWRSFRAALGPGVRLQLVWLALAGVAAADLAFGLLALDSGALLGPVVGSLGAAGTVFLLLVRPWLAVCLTGLPGACHAARRWPELGAAARRAMALAGVSPARTVLLVLVDGAVLVASVLTLATLPFVLGLSLLLQTALVPGAVRQLRRRSAAAGRGRAPARAGRAPAS